MSGWRWRRRSDPVTVDLREQLQSTLGSAYTLERELGGGGMSRVFVAHETTSAGLPFYTMPLVEGESLRARLGRYEIEREIDAGGMATVYLALVDVMG